MSAARHGQARQLPARLSGQRQGRQGNRTRGGTRTGSRTGPSTDHAALAEQLAGVRALVAVFVVASVTGLVFGGLRVADAMGAANTYSRTAQLAVLAQQATGLAQAMENERDGTPAYTAYRSARRRRNRGQGRAVGRRADHSGAGTPERRRSTAAETVTDATGAADESLAAAIGSGVPGQHPGQGRRASSP